MMAILRSRQVLCLVSFAALVTYYYFQPATGWVSRSGVAVITTMWLWQLAAVVFRKDRHTWVWYFLTAGTGCFAAAGSINIIWKQLYGSFPFPGPADVFFLAVYPFVGIGFVVLIWHRREEDSMVSEVIGTAVLMVSVVGQAFTIPAIWIPVSRLDLSGFSKVLIIAYPILDLVVLAIGIAVFLAIHPIQVDVKHWTSSTQLWLVVGGLSGLLVSDTAFDYVSVRWLWDQPSWVDIGWFVWFLAWALAALEPDRSSAGSKKHES